MTISRDFKGIWIPREIWLNPNISMQAKCLWAEIDSLHDRSLGGCFASNEYLCEFMGLKLRRLQELLSELKKHGLLEQCSFDGRQRVLKAKIPDEEPETERITGVQNNAPRGCGKMHPPRAESCTPSYIERKEENKDKNIAQSHASHGHEPRTEFGFSSSSGKFENITEDDLSSWRSAFPDVDIDREIIKSEQWLLANPTKSRKKLWRKFLIGWFSRVQEKTENKKAYRQNTKEKSRANPNISEEQKKQYDELF